MILESGFQIWSALCERGGVDTSHYDIALEEDLKEVFCFDVDRTLAESLEHSSVNATDFLSKLLPIARPYILIFQDILKTAQKIAATQGRDNLQIRFDFDEEHSLNIDLNAFRTQAEQVVSVLRPIRIEKWNYRRFWDLSRAFGDISEEAPFPTNHPHADLQPWVDEYENGNWPSFDIAEPTSGITNLDELLAHVTSLHRAVVTPARQLGLRRDDLKRYNFPPQDTELEFRDGAVSPDDEVAGFLRWLHSDNWSVAVARKATGCADIVRDDPSRADEFIRALRNVLHNPPPEERLQEDVVSELQELLQLPIWKLRSELYSVWVFCRCINVMESVSPVEFQFNDGLFDIPFRAKRLATLQGVEPPIHLWSEVRTPLDSPRGKSRKSGMQPDYTLTSDSSEPPTDAFGIVEVKQYRRASRSNFADALSDYAKGQRNAEVMLVNYGPAPDSILKHVPDEFKPRVQLLGSMCPDSPEAVQTWERWLSELLNNHCVIISTSTAEIGDSLPFVDGFDKALCRLTWQETPSDLDLHVRTPVWLANQQINYSECGTITNAPWVHLDKDVTTGFGPETIQFSKAVRGWYRVAVHQYSSDGQLSNSGAKVSVELIGSTIQSFECPRDGLGVWWHVCDVDFQSKTILPVNRLSDVSPLAEARR
jgi:hypothetical protein